MKRLVVFDFDWSLIDQNSDVWIIEQLSPIIAKQINELKEKYQWTDLMNYLVGEIYKQGITKQQFEQAFAAIPFKPEMIEALKMIKSANGDIIILSDANTVYIEAILKAYEVIDLISNIISNPAAWDEDGRLHIRRLNNIPHGCENPCSENICKGHELIKFLSAHPNEYYQIIYVGDSFNDFCPATKINDILLAREGFKLASFLNDTLPSSHEYKNMNRQISPRIIYWKDAVRILEFINDIFGKSK
ncbi:phosphatase phospho-type [Gigaspora rosea]|uniref:Phosphatase phospho-type n=1 Tax=Gigaspora rosea TaxID=44941 RepID=A0A397V4R7_9GLOM|nr:phosphatase phospho-type [Gigaspora rosea]